MNWELLKNSLLLGTTSTCLSMAAGTMAALWVAGLPTRPRLAFLATAIVALALPPFLLTNCWLHYLGHMGVWHNWLPLNLFSLGGAVWIISLNLWPLSLLLVWGAWQRLEPSQLEADMMVTGVALFRALLFPIARGAMAQAALVTFVLALNNFAVPAILQIKVFPAEMWIRFNTTFDTLGALKLSWPLVLGPLLVLAWFSRREVAWPNREAPVSAKLFRKQLGRKWFWTCGACSLFACVCSVVIPLFQILSVRRTWTELPGAAAAGQSAIWNSLFYAASSATLLLFCVLIIGAQIAKPAARPFRISERVRAGARLIFFVAAWLAFLIPGVLLGIGLIHAFNHDWTSAFYQSSGIVLLAFTIRYAAIGWQGIQHALRKVDPDLVDVARLEGATGWQLLRYVVWPQIRRPVAVTWYVVFLLCLWDVESILLVVPPGGESLALRIFNLLHYGHNAQVNSLCFLLLALALVPLFMERIFSLTRMARLPSAFRRSTRSVRGAGISVFAMVGLLVLFATGCSRSERSLSLGSQFFSRVQIIGVRGVGVGQLNKPRSLAVGADDSVYVVDMTGRVQEFSPSGAFVLSWQMPEIERGKPKGMCRDRQGNILVVEPHYSRVNVFSPTGKLLAQWGSHGTNIGQFSLPRGVAVTSRGDVLVSEYEEAERVQRYRFGPAGLSPAKTGARPELSLPPAWIGNIGRPGNGPGEFNRPEGICVDSADRIYVADSCNHRIQVFDSEGKFLRSYGKPGKGLGELSYPYDICVDKAGRQYVCEFGNSRIQVFDANDRPIEIIGSPGAEPGRFNNPWGVGLDSAGNLYVADSQNHRLQKLLRRP